MWLQLARQAANPQSGAGWNAPDTPGMLTGKTQHAHFLLHTMLSYLHL